MGGVQRRFEKKKICNRAQMACMARRTMMAAAITVGGKSLLFFFFFFLRVWDAQKKFRGRKKK